MFNMRLSIGKFSSGFLPVSGGSRMPVLLARADVRKCYRRILVPVDFSDAARVSARAAIHLWPAAQVVFLHAFGLPNEEGTAEDEDSGEGECSRSLRAHRRAMQELRRFCDGLAPADRLISLVAHRGVPAQVICDYARKMNADLIVIGKMRQSRLSALFCGNAARRLADRTACDVLVMP